MVDHLARLAERIERRPWNQPGSDKTWVLSALSEHQKWVRATKRARRVRTR
ncbi:MAG: hypothetical protein WEF50_18470 [Myxococcota bacterium]